MKTEMTPELMVEVIATQLHFIGQQARKGNRWADVAAGDEWTREMWKLAAESRGVRPEDYAPSFPDFLKGAQSIVATRGWTLDGGWTLTRVSVCLVPDDPMFCVRWQGGDTVYVVTSDGSDEVVAEFSEPDLAVALTALGEERI